VQTQVSDGGHDVPLVDVLRPFGRNTENLAIARTGLGSVAIISSGAAPYAEMNPSAFLCHCREADVQETPTSVKCANSGHLLGALYQTFIGCVSAWQRRLTHHLGEGPQ
jgi:hypothetical protein